MWRVKSVTQNKPLYPFKTKKKKNAFSQTNKKKHATIVSPVYRPLLFLFFCHNNCCIDIAVDCYTFNSVLKTDRATNIIIISNIIIKANGRQQQQQQQQQQLDCAIEPIK